MMMHFLQNFWLLLLAGTYSQSVRDNYGKEFIVSLLGNNGQLRLPVLEVIGQQSNTRLTIKFGSRTRTIKMEKRFQRLSHPGLRKGPPPSKHSVKAMHISSSANVAVYKLQGLKRFMCLPVHSLSRTYVVVNYLPSINCMAYFNIVAKEKDTTVKIKFQIGKNGKCSKQSSGSETTVKLRRLGVHGIKCVYDMTGTLISSNKPVVVTAGSECPRRLGNDEMMMMPLEILGTSFVLPSSKDMASLYRVIAPHVRTNIISSEGQAWKTGPRKPIDIQLIPGKSVCISTSKPVHVLSVLQPKGRHGLRIGTQVITNQVPSTGHFLQKYTIHADGMHGGGKRHLKYAVTAVVQKDVADRLIASLEKQEGTKITRHAISSCQFVILTTPLSFKGLLTLQSSVPFGLFVYEFGPRMDFGILPGTLLDITNCPTDKGFLYFPGHDWCFRFEQRVVSRILARNMCHHSRGHLVDITSDKKNKVIKNSYGKLQVTNKDTTIFTGAFRYPKYNRTGGWLWNDCSAVKHGLWNQGRHPYKCMTLKGNELTWTQTNCHKKASSICEVDVHHGQGKQPRKRETCRKKRHRPRIGDTKRTKSPMREILTSATSQTTVSTAMAAQSSIKASLQHNVSNHRNFITRHKDDNTPSPTVSEVPLSKHHETEKTTTRVTTSTPTELQYEEYEMKDDYDEFPKEQMGSEDTVGVEIEPLKPGTSPQKPQPIEDYETRADYEDDQKEKLDNEHVTPAKTSTTEAENNGSLTTNSSGMKTTINISATMQSEKRSLNMTLVMEAYMKHTKDAKSILAKRAHILALAQKTKKRCHCFCKARRLQNTSREAIEEHKIQVKKELGVKKATLRKTLSKRMSANDNRPSATLVGCIGFFFLLLPIGIIVLSDIYMLLARRKERSEKEKKTDLYENLSNERKSSIKSDSQSN